MRIGALACQTGVSTRSLRHYESLGIIRSLREENGYRDYLPDAAEYVRATQFLLCSGLRLSTIAEILPSLMDDRCRLSDKRIRDAIELAAKRIELKLDQLQQSHDILTKALRKGAIRRPGT